MKLFNAFSKKRKEMLVDKRELLSAFHAYKILYEDNDEAIFILNYMGQIESINKAGYELFGLTRKEFKRTYAFIKEDYIEIATYYFNKALNGITEEFKVVCTHKNGVNLDVSIKCIPIKVKGTIIGVYAIVDETIVKINKRFDSILLSLEATEKASKVGSWEYDCVKNEKYWSKQLYELLQIPEESKRAPSLKEFLQIVHVDDKQRVEAYYYKVFSEGIDSTIEYRIIHPSGEERIIFERSITISNENHDVRIIGTLKDITESIQLLQKVDERDSQIRNLIDNLDVFIWSFDTKKKEVLYYSKGIETLYGLSEEEFIDDPLIWIKVIHRDDLSAVESRRNDLYKGKRFNLRYRIINKKGQEKWVDDCKVPILDANGQLIRVDGIITNITEQMKREKQLDFYANHDYLTNLPNRRYFKKELNELIKQSIKFVVLKIDLDRFKYINYALGHEIGDKMLQSIGGLLQKNVKPESFLARLEGNDFAFYLRDVMNIEEGIVFAKEIHELLKRPVYVDGDNADAILNKAAIALEKVKKNGRNDLQTYASTMDIQTFKRFELERDMRKALILKEFFLEYQPIVETKTGMIKGLEALIRWKHPSWGTVAPNEFISLAEEIGLIIDISDWVLKQVCSQLEKWGQQRIPLVPISVNFSPIQLLKYNFIESVRTTITRYNVNPALLTFEITENSLISDYGQMNEVISQLNEDGITFALDDFGTGYSSLTQLKDLPIQVIKIDKSFISEINQQSNTVGIIKSIIYLAKEIGLKVVAEGVEDKDQLTFLTQRECDLTQGHLFSRSVSVHEIERMLKGGKLKPIEKRVNTMSIENRRNYYRINFDFPLASEMTIIEFKGRKVSLGKSKLLIQDMSLGGLRFINNIDLPVQPEIILKFTFTILDKKVEVRGFITWKNELENEFYEYGVQFILTDIERDKLAPLFNQLNVLLKENPLPQGCDFIMDNKATFFS